MTTYNGFNPTKNAFLSLVGGVALITIISTVGCGSGALGGGPGGSPSSATRSALLTFQNFTSKSFSQGGFQSSNIAMNSNMANNAPGGVGSGAGGPGSSGGSGGSSSSSAGNSGLPMIGGFFRNVANVPHASRSTAISRMARNTRATRISREETFYYDDWLQLWVDFADTPGQTTYLFYIDEAKTMPAGSAVSTYATDYTVFPQVYSSKYSFTAGTAQGSHGEYNSIYNADFSGSTTYNSVWNDGSSYSGQSSNLADGTYSWSSTSSFDKLKFNDRGTFKSDGSGTTHSDSSDGHATDFVFNADGSGSGKFSGPEPGLPAIIKWDNTGAGTITYADGTTEKLPFFMFGGIAVGVVEPATDSGPDGTGTNTKAIKHKN